MEKFTKIISNAIKDMISDIYITGGHPTVSRKFGNIQFHKNISWSHQEVDGLVRYLLNARQLDALRERKSFDYALSLTNARLRINIFLTTRGLSLAIRILPGHIPTVEELNLHPSLNEIAMLKSGLVLNCGPTGVGKTTTVAAIIEEINRTRAAHIITLENPIEYRFRSKMSFIQQRELGTHMPSFEQGLLDVLRENPDVIVIGELRESETMKLTMNAAESGHLVIATLHASTPEEALYRLCNAVNIEAQNEIRFQLASTLSWLVVQHLFYFEKLGYRVPLLTIVRGTSSVKNVVRENKLHQLESAMQIGSQEGMFSSDRYMNEYLSLRKNFTPPLEIFHPSKEAFEEISYNSTLMEEKTPVASVAGLSHQIIDETISKRTPFSDGHGDEILTIDNSDSLSELLIRFEKLIP